MERITEVINRAEELGCLIDKRFNHMIDISYADKVFGIDYDAWLNADDTNFLHDFFGIYKNIDRAAINVKHSATENDFNYFVPRFATK